MSPPPQPPRPASPTPLAASWPRLRRLADAAALALVLLAIAGARVVWRARAEWRAAQASDGEARVAHLGAAARAYLPGNPYARRAVDALAGLGRSGGPDSPAAWQTLRSALRATRSWTPRAPALAAEADAALARALAAAEAPGTPARPAALGFHAARLAADDAPALGWTLVALVGLGAWIGAALGFIGGAFDEAARLRERAALGWAIGIAAGLVLFFLGLSHA